MQVCSHGFRAQKALKNSHGDIAFKCINHFNEQATPMKMTDVFVPSQLKFLMNNMRAIIHIQLTTENYPLWKSQISKLFTENGFEGYLDTSTPKPEKKTVDESGNVILNPSFNTWILIDQNLSVALYSMISPSLLSYVLNLETIEWRLQSMNHSRILQLKNELYHIQMRERSMEYLSKIKNKCDVIAASRSALTTEDVVLYTLNGLPSGYQAFYDNHTNQPSTPIRLDDFYALLCSEELNISA